MVRILLLTVHNIFYTFKQIIQFKQINSYRQADMYHLFHSKVLIANLNEIQFLSKSIENRDPLHRNSACRKTNSISDIVIQQFLITRTISLKKNWIQHQVKTTTKNILKKAYMESKTVMLINSVLMTTLIPLNLKI